MRNKFSELIKKTNFAPLVCTAGIEVKYRSRIKTIYIKYKVGYNLV